MNKYFKLNQTVYHPIHGEGKVISPYLNKYPVSVQFKHKEVAFTEDGREEHEEPITLSQTPIPEIVNKPLEDTYVPFTFEDREFLKGKWIREKGNTIWETMIIFINHAKVGVDGGMYYSYEELLNRFEFVDGKVCGKLAN